ncbi:hypothetical protein [Corynebacterium pelargi]|uniref:PPE family protein n=1 Tax=Corynebacterium pelargi TaxID=1471400 RepID=A0A410W7I6_9CORY|nr:hypothetical protein [Corynebacterium pelargi]QAU51887.1 hypothetical protein CPELA_03020 [Corynebacterium pelargi]
MSSAAPALAAFSPVSGLDQLGAQHALVLAGSPGSAASVAKSLSKQVAWLYEALKATASSLGMQNDFVQRAMDVADEGGYVGDMAALFPMRPIPTIPGFSFAPPVMVPATSVEQLVAQFNATNEAGGLEGARQWSQLGAAAANLATSLESVAAQLLASTEGLAFDRAAAKISEVAVTAGNFAANCEVMAASVSSMVGIHQRHLPQVLAAQAQVQAASDPRAKMMAEQSALAQLNPAIAADLPTGMPMIRSLVAPAVAGLGGGIARTGMGVIPGKGKLNTAGLGATGAPSEPLRASVHTPGGSFEAVAAAANEASPQALGDAATKQASVAQAPGQFAQASAQQLGAGAGQPAAPLSATSQPASHSPGATMTGLGTPVQQQSLASGRPSALGNTPGAHSSRRSNHTGAAALGALAAGGAAMGMGGLGGSGLAHAGGYPGGAAGNAVGPRALAGPSAATSPHALAGAGGGGAGASTSGMRGSTGGLTPMMAAQPGGRERRNTKVKGITNAVEKNHNLKMLLGQQEPVVPRVIGAWVRQ